MTAPNVKRVLALVVLAVAVLTVTSAESVAQFQYPPYGALRGRMVDRDGVFNVTRYRWGNGITPQGAAVLISGIEAVAPVLPVLAGSVGRGTDETARDAQSRSAARSPIRFEAPEDYVIEQRRANDLLVRTARLVDPSFSAGPAPPDGSPNLTKPLSQLLNEHGSNPWDALPIVP